MAPRLDRSKPQLVFGLKAGLMAGAVLLVPLALTELLGADDSSLPANISLREQITLFLGGATAGGLILGVGMPLTRRLWGSALLGMLIVSPYFLGQLWLSSGQAATRLDLVGTITAIVVVGGGVGWWAGARYPTKESGATGS